MFALNIRRADLDVGRTGGGVAGAIYPSPGSIYVFERAGDGWEFAYIITGDDVEIGDEFGAALAVDGERLLVGSPGRDGGRGGAQVFERGDDGQWVQRVEFVPPADGEIRGAGSAQVFRVAEATMALEGENTIPAPGFSRGALFGSFVALRDDVAVVAASNADMRLGAAVVYERDNGTWVEGATLRESTRTLDALTGEQAPCTDGATGPFDCSQVDLVAFVPLEALGADPGTIL